MDKTNTELVVKDFISSLEIALKNIEDKLETLNKEANSAHKETLGEAIRDYENKCVGEHVTHTPFYVICSEFHMRTVIYAENIHHAGHKANKLWPHWIPCAINTAETHSWPIIPLALFTSLIKTLAN